MKNAFVVCCGLILFIGPTAAVPGAEPSPERRHEIAAAVRAVFSAKCVACHGSQLARPKGRFGYVLDLRRVAANPEMVIPGKPGESELWELVRRGEMPPEDAPAGPPTAEQKESIRRWIEAGAPADDDAARTPSASAEAAPAEEAKPAAPSGLRRTLQQAGKFHLLLLHFPIALLVTAAARELWLAVRGEQNAAPAVRFCVRCAAAAAVPTAALGWLYAASGLGTSSPGLLSWHRWLGTAAAAGAVAAALALERDARRGERSAASRLLVLLAAALVGAAAHFGGLLTHGDDFFDW